MTSATPDGPGPSSNGATAGARTSVPAPASAPPPAPAAASGLAPLPPASALTRFLDLPAFLLASAILYWSVALGVLLGYIRPWAGRKPRDDALGWATTLQRLMGIRMMVLPGPRLYTGGPAVYLANHRSWADFYLDPIATGGRAQMLSRLAVAVAFPMMMPAVIAVRAVVLFNRGKGAASDHAAFNASVRAKMERSPMAGLIVYPEGHRSTRPDPLPFKHGMLRFAHAEGLPIQAVVSAGKEGVMAEKRGTARWGRTVVIAYGPPLDPAAFPGDFPGFLAAFTASFTEAWSRAHAPGAVAAATPLPPPTLDGHVYPRDLARAQALVSPAIVAAFLAAVALVGRWVVGAVSRASPSVTAAVVAWCVVSAVRAARPPAGGVPQGTGRQGKPRAE